MKKLFLLLATLFALAFASSASAALPSGVTLQPIDGGSNYYCSHGFTQACNGGWDNPSFFPIGPFWGSYVGEQTTWNTLNWNTEFYSTSQADVNALTTDGKFAIPAASVSPTANTVGFDAADEPSSWSAATSAVNSTSNASQDSRFWYVNNTWNMSVYGPPSGTPGGTQSSFFSDPITTPNSTTRHFDLGSYDEYWYALATSSLTYNSLYQGGIQYNLSGNMTPDQAKCGCRYGDMLRNVFGTSVGLPSGRSEAPWQTTYPAPLFSYVEDADAFVTGTPNVMTPPEMAWAVWSSIIHGARGIIYFDHSQSASGCVSDNFVTTTCANTIQPGQTKSIDDKMAQIDSSVKTLAPEINDPTALGYVTPSPAPTTFGGVEDRAVYDANSNSFYIFATTRTTNNTSTSATYTTAGSYSGSIPVYGESRNVTATNGVFHDSFLHGSTVHIYGPIPNV